MPGVFHPWTQLEVSFRKTDEMMENWKENTLEGFTYYVAIVAPILILISFLPTLYHCFVKIRKSAKKPPHSNDMHDSLIH